MTTKLQIVTLILSCFLFSNCGSSDEVQLNWDKDTSIIVNKDKAIGKYVANPLKNNENPQNKVLLLSKPRFVQTVENWAGVTILFNKDNINLDNGKIFKMQVYFLKPTNLRIALEPISDPKNLGLSYYIGINSPDSLNKWVDISLDYSKIPNPGIDQKTLQKISFFIDYGANEEEDKIVFVDNVKQILNNKESIFWLAFESNSENINNFGGGISYIADNPSNVNSEINTSKKAIKIIKPSGRKFMLTSLSLIDLSKNYALKKQKTKTLTYKAFFVQPCQISIKLTKDTVNTESVINEHIVRINSADSLNCWIDLKYDLKTNKDIEFQWIAFAINYQELFNTDYFVYLNGLKIK